MTEGQATVLSLQEPALQAVAMCFAMAFRYTVKVMLGACIVILHHLAMLAAYPVVHRPSSLTASLWGVSVMQWIVAQW